MLDCEAPAAVRTPTTVAFGAADAVGVGSSQAEVDNGYCVPHFFIREMLRPDCAISDQGASDGSPSQLNWADSSPKQQTRSNSMLESASQPTDIPAPAAPPACNGAALPPSAEPVKFVPEEPKSFSDLGLGEETLEGLVLKLLLSLFGFHPMKIHQMAFQF